MAGTWRDKPHREDLGGVGDGRGDRAKHLAGFAGLGDRPAGRNLCGSRRIRRKPTRAVATLCSVLKANAHYMKSVPAKNLAKPIQLIKIAVGDRQGAAIDTCMIDRHTHLEMRGQIRLERAGVGVLFGP